MSYYLDFLMYYRAIMVAVLATVTDMSLMFTLLYETHLNDSIILGISSFVGMVIQFVGQKYWTFKNTSSKFSELFRQIFMFFALEISVIMLVIIIYSHLSYHVDEAVQHLPDSYVTGKISSKFVERDENDQKIQLTVIGKMILKSLIVFVGFNLISYPMWKFFIFAKRKL